MSEELTFEVFYKDTLIGTCKTSERSELIRQKLTEEQLENLEAGDIVFNVVAF